MAYFTECPYCGAHLDPGERCECMDRRQEARKRQAEANLLVEQEGMWEQQIFEF